MMTVLLSVSEFGLDSVCTLGKGELKIDMSLIAISWPITKNSYDFQMHL